MDSDNSHVPKGQQPLPNQEVVAAPEGPQVVIQRQVDNSSAYSPSIAISQPERENTPITLDSSTPSDHENQEPIDLDDRNEEHPTTTDPHNTVELEAEHQPLEEHTETAHFANCQEIEDNVFHFDTFVAETETQPKEESLEFPILMMEDNLPYVQAPLEPCEEQAFCLEIPVSAKILEAWSRESDISNMSCVAAAGKRARAEVALKTLTPEEKRLFSLAKEKELSCWLQTNAIRPILHEKWTQTRCWGHVGFQNGKVMTMVARKQKRVSLFSAI